MERQRRSVNSHGDTVHLFLNLCLVLILVFPLFFSLDAPAASAGGSQGSEDLFTESRMILWDEEMLLVSPHPSDPTTAECFLPDPEYFRRASGVVLGPDYSCSDVWYRLNQDSAWETSTFYEGENGGDYDVALLRDKNGAAILGQAWCSESGTVSVSLAAVDQDGFGTEEPLTVVAENCRGIAVAAGHFSGDWSTSLVAAYAGEDDRLHFSFFPTPGSASGPVLSVGPDISSDPEKSVLSVAAGDVDGDRHDELAVLYMTPGAGFALSLFTVSGEGEVSLLGTHGLDVPGSGQYTPSVQGDLAFADWEGNGRAMLACVVHLENMIGQAPHAWLVSVDLSRVPVSFTEVFQRALETAVDGSLGSGSLKADAGDLDGDGMDELVFAWAAGQKDDVYTVPWETSTTWYTTTDVVMLTHAPFGRTPTEVVPVRFSVKIPERDYYGEDLPQIDLAVGHFTGQLNPSAQSNRAQAVVAVSDPYTRISYVYLLTSYWRNIGAPGFDLLETRSCSLLPGPYLVTGDLDGDSMLLGEPTHITLENQITPLLFLQEPPKHVDGNATGQATNYTRYSDLYLQYAQSRTESEATTNELDVESDLAVSLSVEVDAGVDLGAASFSAREKGTLTKSVGSRYDEIEKNYSTQSTSLTGKTNRDDFVLFRCHNVNVWRYPIQGWLREPRPGEDEGQAFYQVIVPDSSPEDLAIHLMSGLNVDWYQPVHMNGNVLSYPSSSGQIPGFLEDNLLSGLVTLDVGGGNSESRTIQWSSETVEEKVKSLRVSMSVDSETQMGGSARGTFVKGGVSTALDVHLDDSLTRSSSSTTSVTKDNAFNVEVPVISSPLPYSVTPLMCITGGGILKTGHVTSGISDDTGWLAAYGAAPDPALNLPRTWKFSSVSHNTEEESWEWSDAAGAREIRGIFFRNEDGLDLGVSIPLGRPFTVDVRVHNLSLQPIPGSVTVAFEAAVVDPATGTLGERFSLGTTTTDPIAQWGTSPANWEWASLTVDSPVVEAIGEGNYRIFVTVDPDDALPELPAHDLNETYDNNRGWFDVFFHHPDTEAAALAEKGAGLAAEAGMPGFICSLEADAPLEEPFYAAGEEVAFRGRIVNDSDASVRDLMVFFYDGNPEEGGRAFDVEHLAGLLPGAGALLSVSHIFEDEPTREVFMKVHPKPGYTATAASVAIPMADPSGGCSVGSVGTGHISGMILLVGCTVFFMRRR